MIDKSSNVAIYEPGTYNVRGQMTYSAMNNKQLYTTYGYDNFGLPTYRMTGSYYQGSNNIQYLETGFDPATGNLSWRKDRNRNLTEHFTYDLIHKNRLATWQVLGQELYSTSYNDANGNIRYKTDFTSPENEYSYGKDAGPHAVTGIESPLILPAEAEQQIQYNSFNKASLITHLEQDLQLVLHYGPNEQRIKTEFRTNGQTILTKYFPVGGLEVEVSSNGDERWLHYLPGGGVYVCDKDFNKTGMYYVLTDYLGSWHKVITESGLTTEEYSFDPWGRRRNPADWTYNNVPVTFLFDRGYTGHEMLDSFGLVNMNGRMYDPVLGRMLSPDNYVQSPFSTQAYNRYSYAQNNPLIYTDPSGDMPFLAIAAFAAYNAFVAGHMAKDSKQGFVGGFTRSFVTSMATSYIGGSIGGALNGSGALSSGVNAAVVGGITYGIDAAINNSASWNGFALNAGMAMFMGGIEGGFAAEKNNLDFWTGKPSSEAPQGYLRLFNPGRGYGMSFEGDPPGWVWGTNGRGAVLNITGPEIVATSQTAGVGQPGALESCIPIWGSGRAAVDHFQNGNYWRGIAYSALAVTDVFLVKAAATAIAKGTITLAAKYALREAVANPSLTVREAAAAIRNPGLEALMNGKGVDRAFSIAANNNLILRPAQSIGLIKLSPMNRGADMVGKGILRGTWWDVTTSGSWGAHVTKYGPGGIGLIYP